MTRGYPLPHASSDGFSGRRSRESHPRRLTLAADPALDRRPVRVSPRVDASGLDSRAGRRLHAWTRIPRERDCLRGEANRPDGMKKAPIPRRLLHPPAPTPSGAVSEAPSRVWSRSLGDPSIRVCGVCGVESPQLAESPGALGATTGRDRLNRRNVFYASALRTFPRLTPRVVLRERAARRGRALATSRRSDPVVDLRPLRPRASAPAGSEACASCCRPSSPRRSSPRRPLPARGPRRSRAARRCGPSSRAPAAPR